MASSSKSSDSDTVDISDDSCHIRDSDVEQKVEFIQKNWLRNTNKKKKVVIVTAGKSGAGKSTLI